MEFKQTLHKATLIKRYKRFLADVVLESGEEVTAHCPNTGSMKTCGSEGDVVYLSYHDSPTRKLKYTWEFTVCDSGLIGVNTSKPNHIVAEGIQEGLVSELAGYASLKQEVKYGEKSRVDILLQGTKTDPEAKCWVEVKNVTLLHDGAVVFPDAKTARGLKHIKELEAQVEAGDRAMMFYLVNRQDGAYFSIADHIDPDYYKALLQAMERGVEVLAYRANSSLDQVVIGEKVEFRR